MTIADLFHECRNCHRQQSTAERACYGSLCENCTVATWLRLGIAGINHMANPGSWGGYTTQPKEKAHA